MAAPNADDLSAFLGRVVDAAQAGAVITAVTAFARAYTREAGFTDGEPNGDVGAVILTAAARLISEPSQIVQNDTMGPFQVSYRGGFDGWSTTELAVLNGYRVRAI